MNQVQSFLAHAVQLEREAARRYEELSAAMGTEGNAEVRQFFGRMARNSRKHLADAVARGGFRDVPTLQPDEFQWPDGVSPEVADWEGVDGLIDVRYALELALASEQRGHAYYAAMAAGSGDPEVRLLADEFAGEEAEHVAELRRLLAACPA